MALKAGYWACYAGALTAAGSGAMENRHAAWEGITPSEWGISDTTDSTGTANNYWEYTLPLPPSNTLVAGDYEVAFRAKVTGVLGPEAGITARLRVNDATDYDSSEVTVDSTAYADYAATITLASDVTGINSMVLRIVMTTDSCTDFYLCDCYATGSTPYVGVKSTSSTGTDRTPATLTPLSPATGTHANPTAIAATPTFLLEGRYLYASDLPRLVKYTDTVYTVAHSASGASTQTFTSVDAETDSLSAGGVRTMTLEADATRKPDSITNTYYVVEIENSGDTDDEVTQAYELRLAVERPTLTTLNGTSGTPLTIVDPAPVAQWTHTNASATHAQVKVYDASDDSLDHDSEEFACTDLQGAYVIDGTDLADTKTYYVIVTVMNGSGGSTWTVDSNRGYFVLDWGSTAVKQTWAEGTSDLPEVITDTSPAVTWSFSRTQAAYNLDVIDASDESVDYETGWIVSATESKTLPDDTLTVGKTYSIGVQVKDAQGRVYTSRRVWVHVNESPLAAPVLDAEGDCTTADEVTLSWTASVTTDSDTLTYELELTRPDTSTTTWTGITGTSFYLGRLSST